VAMLAYGAPAAMAAKPKKSPEQRFARLDKDGDKKLTEEEFIGKKTDEAKSKAEKRFSRLDKDKDHSLSFEEFNVTPKKKAE
jgi:hypothetical protein